MSQLKSPLARARGLGASKTGVKEWWHLRFLAILLIPLSIWFVCCLLNLVNSTNETFIKILISPFNTVMLILFLGISIYHGALGMKEIIEDYVKSEGTKFWLIIIIRAFSILTIALAISAIMLFHFTVFNSVPNVMS